MKPSAVAFLLLCALSPAAAAQSPAPAAPVIVRIDAAQRFQTIDGFGGYGAADVWWSKAPHFDRRFVHRLIDDLGLTILRDSVPMGLEAENDNGDPYVTDYARIERFERVPGDETDPAQHFLYLRAMHEAGLQRLVATVWSPPAWMKYNGRLGNGTSRSNSAPAYTRTPGPQTNQLRDDEYAEFAEFCVAYIRLLKRRTGIDLYAISLQNEPRFSQFYASAVYDPDSLAKLIKVVGQRFRREGITTKIFAPEDVNNVKTIRRYLGAILGDPLANRYVDIFAVHNYKADGVTASESAPRDWQSTYAAAAAGGKRLWMTETSGFDSHSITGALSLARSMYNALYYGRVSAWLYWQMSVSRGEGLIENGRPTLLYYVSKQFYKNIRPGAVRIGASSSDGDLLALAFSGPPGLSKTVVLINLSAAPRRAFISGDAGASAARAITTSAGAQYRETPLEQPAVKGVYCPGLSVTTLLLRP